MSIHSVTLVNLIRRASLPSSPHILRRALIVFEDVVVVLEERQSDPQLSFSLPLSRVIFQKFFHAQHAAQSKYLNLKSLISEFAS